MADQITTTSRVCSKCGITKPATVEHFDNYRDRGKVRQSTFCKECRKARLRAYRAANPDKVAEWDRRNRERNRGAGSDYQKRKYARVDRAKARENLRRWKAANPEKAKAIEDARNARVLAQRHSDPEFRERLNKKVREWAAKKRRTDKEWRAAQYARTRVWHRENRDRQSVYKRDLNRKRRSYDLNFRIASSLRGRFIRAVKGGYKGGSAVRMLGCSIDEFREYMEKQFRDGMTWENWGRGWGGAKEWHIDHIIPLSSFDLTDAEQAAKACHYTNLQPLWAEENLMKGAA